MKIRVSLKDPDSMHDAVEDAVRADIKETTDGLSQKERDYLLDERVGPVQGEITARWMPYGEYLYVEFDTDTWTATVLSAKEWK